MYESIKQIVLSFGADVCGIANIERFAKEREGFSPLDILPDCQSVIVFGVVLPKGLTKVEPRLVYGHFNSLSCLEVDKISFQVSKRLERGYDCIAVPVPCDSPYEYWDNNSLHGRGLISMKHAAAASGIGSIGKNSLLINPQYGSLLTIGALLTNLDLASDKLCDEMCIAGCTKCIDSCPAGAIENGAVNQKLCRLHTYGKTDRGFDTVDCNLCRVVCPMRFGKFERLR